MKLQTFIIIILVSFTNLVSAQNYKTDQVGKVMQATGYVSTAQMTLKKIMQHCGGKFSNLKSTTNTAYKKWLDSNKDVLNRSNNMYKLVMDDIKEKGGVSVSDSFNKKTQNKLNDESDLVVKKLNAENINKQESVCKNWATSIMDGAWDIKNKHLPIYNFIMSK